MTPLPLPLTHEDPAPAPPETEIAGREVALFGYDPLTRIVAVEVTGANAVLIRRLEEGVTRQIVPFTPWLMAAENPPLAGCSWTELQGTGYKWLASFRTWPECLNAADALRERGVPLLVYRFPAKQYLMATGQTLFQGMNFDEIVRMQVDLETTSLSPTAPEARILLIAASDNQGNEWVFAGEDEAQMLRDFVQMVQQADPDTIEGHNLYAFDFPYLIARAQAMGVPLAIGRDSSELALGRERRCPMGGNYRTFLPPYVWGRHCLDTLFGVQRWDVARGEMESYGLKECAQVFGIAEPDRIILDRSVLHELWKTDPERVRTYALQDVRETRRLAELVFPTEFYQSQMVPDSFQNNATGGSGEKVNSLMVREYLRRRYAVPRQQPARAYPGGHTEVRRTGVIRRVVKADVESLYPSIMRHFQVAPKSDALGVFLPMLTELTARRLDAKGRMRGATGSEKYYWDGLQGSFKILINSFYGYVGGPFHFNDMDAAEQVTVTGQRIVKQIADLLEQSGSQVIEIDTDGVYFVPPPGVDGKEAEEAYVEQLGASLPHGIRLAHDGRYEAMVSLKIKNYVLVDYDGQKHYTGASVRSRAEERFGREFLARAMDHLIAGDLEALGRDYAAIASQISSGQMPVEQFSRRERVTEKTFSSDAKKKSRELMTDDHRVGDMMQVYQKADGSLGLVEDYAADEDRFYYLDKLYKFALRLKEVIGADFERLCPRPVKKRVQAEQAGQMSLDF